jgi:hypothetical protein
LPEVYAVYCSGSETPPEQPDGFVLMLDLLFPDVSPPATHQFTKEVEGPAVAGEGKARRFAGMDGDLISGCATASNLYHNLVQRAEQSGDSDFLGYRPIQDGVPQAYVWFTYSQILKRVNNLG